MTQGLTVTIAANTISPSSSSFSSKDSLPTVTANPFQTDAMEEESKSRVEDEPMFDMDAAAPVTLKEEVNGGLALGEEEQVPAPTEDVKGTAAAPVTSVEHEGQQNDNALKTVTSPTNGTAASNYASTTDTTTPKSDKIAPDRAQEVTMSDMGDAKTPDSFTGKFADDEDNDSSNDDSSYFADPSNLPSPKSGGRKYSFSSHHSAPHASLSRRAADAARESDASLSLSDSEDEDGNRHSDSGLFPTPRGTPDVYPQRIMRVHSVGSLISTSSHNSSEDPIVSEELNLVAAGGIIIGARGEISNGRLSPVQGSRLSFASPASVSQPQPSPPTIMPYQYSYQQNYAHPQAQTARSSSAEEWIAAMAANQQQQQKFGIQPAGGSGWSEGTLNYSDDGDMHAFQQNGSQAGGGGASSGSAQRSASRNRLTNRSSGGGSKPKGPKVVTLSSRSDSGSPDAAADDDDDGDYKVYWQRWVMLMYMSLLNLLSDWTCYSVAPIALLTQQAFGNINPEQLVIVFLGANALSTACEPIILSRLGLRRTVLFGALLLMIGSIVKSGGMPPIIQAELTKGEGEWRVYLGFFVVGLSQPLYQCTPALLSASWFPEKERTMATGVALNANQLGIGFAFIFGTLLVAKSDDIPGYFGLLSIISTITFFGALFHFEDAPPTPPSQTARVVRGSLDVRLPNVQEVLQSIGLSGGSDIQRDINAAMKDDSADAAAVREKGSRAASSKRRSNTGKGQQRAAPAPSSAPWDDVVGAPSPMMPGPVGNAPSGASASESEEEQEEGTHPQSQLPPPGQGMPYAFGGQPPYYGAVPPPPPQMGYPMYPGMGYPNVPAPQYEYQQGNMQYGSTQTGSAPFGGGPPGTGPFGGGPPGSAPFGAGPPGSAPYGGGPPGSAPYGGEGMMSPPQYGFAPQGYPPYPMPFYDPRTGQYMYPPPPPQYFAPPQIQNDPYGQQESQSARPGVTNPYGLLPPASAIDEGAEPVLTITNHHLDINIRDDQVLLSIRACLSRPGFIHALVSFTVSGIVINTLSTFMDYLVRLNGAGREYTGIVGGSFQFVIMLSSLTIGGLTDRSRAYYSVTVGMLVLGAFGLAECGVSLSADRGSDLRWSLIVVAVLVGPLQPVSTELGVEVVYPLSENTVLVIQQLFSNLLSALFIPCFKMMKDIGINKTNDGVEQPEYTFSFYLLIVLHAAATVFFATFSGRYLRYEDELIKKDERGRNKEEKKRLAYIDANEKQPLMHPIV